MKVIQSNPRDGLALLHKLKLKEFELKQRFGQQDANQKYVTEEVMRSVNYVVVGWLKEQGFDVNE